MNTTAASTPAALEASNHRAPQAPAPPRRLLRRSGSDRVVAGVCGGLADYLGIDPAIIRILAVVLALGGGSGVLLYLIAWIAIPEDGGWAEHHGPTPSDPSGTGARTRAADGAGDRAPMLFGALLVGIGGFILLDRILPDIGWLLWPVGLVVAGVLLIASEVRR